MFTLSQLQAAAYRFEMANGRSLEPVERDSVIAAGLERIDPRALADQICGWLDSAPELSNEFRSTAFWALGKSYDFNLLEFFRHHLSREVKRDVAVAYQIMIALDNLSEPVWQPDRRSFSIAERELNHDAAVRYLAERL